MRAKLVNEDFLNGNRKRKYRKGDRVRYEFWVSGSPMLATSRAEKISEKEGIITKVKKNFVGNTVYEIDGMTIPESYILGKVNENMQMPFRNDGNKVITEKRPLENPNYLGDAAGDDKTKKPVWKSKKVSMDWDGGYYHIDDDIQKYIKAGIDPNKIAKSLSQEYEGFQKPGIAWRRVAKFIK
jgi:hypothetical protein